MTDNLIRIFIAPFVILAALLWAIPGLFVGAALLVKAVSIFVFRMFIRAALQERNSENDGGMAADLWSGIKFYPMSFVFMFNILVDPIGSAQNSQPSFQSKRLGEVFIKLLEMFAITTAFWVTTLPAIHHSGLIKVPIVAEFEGFFSNPIVKAESEKRDQLDAERAGGQIESSQPLLSGRLTVAKQTALLSAAGSNRHPIKQIQPGDLVFLNEGERADGEWVRIITATKEKGFVRTKDLIPKP